MISLSNILTVTDLLTKHCQTVRMFNSHDDNDLSDLKVTAMDTDLLNNPVVPIACEIDGSVLHQTLVLQQARYEESLQKFGVVYDANRSMYFFKDPN